MSEVSSLVINSLISEATTIHWHGIHPYETPWTDGTIGVTQAGKLKTLYYNAT